MSDPQRADDARPLDLTRPHQRQAFNLSPAALAAAREWAAAAPPLTETQRAQLAAIFRGVRPAGGTR